MPGRARADPGAAAALRAPDALLNCGNLHHEHGSDSMGKGDMRSRRGKIYRGSFGKSRVKDPAKKKKRATAKK